MEGFCFDIPTRIVFGEHCAREALPRLPELRGKRILIVSSGRSLHRLGYLGELLKCLDAVGETVLFDRVSANPKLEEAAEAIALGRARGAEAVLAFGGGSSIDAAKLAAAGIVSRLSPERIFAENIAPGAPRLPLVAVPTTAGSGSEVSPSAILSDGTVKRSIRGRSLYPDAAVVDPCFTRSLPWGATVETGFDVFAHAVETLVSKKANALSETYSLKAAQLVIESLPLLRADGMHREARASMSFASLLAGLNLTLAGTLLPHRLQYPIGARLDNSHGAGLLALYPAWLREEYPHSREKLDAVARLAGGRDVEDLIRWLEALGARKTLGELGFAPADVPALAAEVRGTLDNDPAYRGPDTVLRLYEKSFE